MSKSTKKKSDAEVAVHLVKARRSAKVVGAGNRGTIRILADAEDAYQAWRKQGFKAAWWWQYFSKSGDTV